MGFLYSCVAVDKISTDMAHCDSCLREEFDKNLQLYTHLTKDNKL